MGIVDLALIEVISQVELHWVPASILKVNQSELAVVIK
jgi:hypothetical protein